MPSFKVKDKGFAGLERSGCHLVVAVSEAEARAATSGDPGALRRSQSSVCVNSSKWRGVTKRRSDCRTHVADPTSTVPARGRRGPVLNNSVLQEEAGLLEKVRSSDGTTIVFDRLGEGSSVVLVSGASTTRAIHAEPAQLLAENFTVFNYDRRGRGESGDTPPYSIEREIEDLEAVIGKAGGEAAVFGNSSGAVLALRATAAGLRITKLALWEPPIMVDPDAPRRQKEYITELKRLLDEDRRGDAMALFMKAVGLPDEMIAAMRNAPMWPDMEALASHARLRRDRDGRQHRSYRRGFFREGSDACAGGKRYRRLGRQRRGRPRRRASERSTPYPRGPDAQRGVGRADSGPYRFLQRLVAGRLDS
jgi:Alpha/beta hydrolase family